jgi:predicted porin
MRIASPLCATRIGVSPVRSRFRRFAALTLLLVLSVAGLPAFSQTPQPASASESDVAELLDILLANGTITQQQYDTLKSHYAARHPMQTSAVQPPAVQPAVIHAAVIQPAAAQPVAAAVPAAATRPAAAAPSPAAQPAQAAKTAELPAKVVTAMDNAVGLHMGQFDLTFSGEINGFYVYDHPEQSGTGCVLCLASVGEEPTSSIRNGLLPGDLTVKISTKQNGFDVAAVFGIWPGIESLMLDPGGINLSGGNSTGFGVAGVDFRQEYLTVGRAKMGTFKFGRDLGFFGQEAILNDMTLFGAGSPNGNNGGAGPGSVTLGRIGLGYIYTDFMPQISWTSPSTHGLQVAGAVFQPLSDAIATTLALPQLSAPLSGDGQPQFQTKVTYTIANHGITKVNLWTNYLTQSMEASVANVASDPLLKIAAGQHVRANGIDYGGKIAFKAANFVGYGYNGWGIGTEGLLFLATSPSGATRPSDGYYFQGTYTFAQKWTLGASYGESNLHTASSGETVCTSTIILCTNSITRDNQSSVGQARYGLSSWVNLVGEYTHTHSESQAGIVSSSNSFALGTIGFF